MIQTKAEQVQTLHDQCYKVALEHVIELARKAMQEDQKLKAFFLAMGMVFFVDNKGDSIQLGERKSITELSDFISKWDEYLHLSGAGIRFTANGPIVTDW